MASKAVLLIEPDPRVGDAVCGILEGFGHRVCRSMNLEEAMAHALAEPFELILAGWFFPVHDAVALCRIVGHGASFAVFDALPNGRPIDPNDLRDTMSI